jgi:hypothetical protein
MGAIRLNNNLYMGRGPATKPHLSLGRMTNIEYILYKIDERKCTVLYGAAKNLCTAGRASTVYCVEASIPGVNEI